MMPSNLPSVGEATVYSLNVAASLNHYMPYSGFDIFQHDVATAIDTRAASCAARTSFFGARAALDGIKTYFVRSERTVKKPGEVPPHASGFIEVDSERFLGVGVDSFYDPETPNADAAFVYFIKRPPILSGMNLGDIINGPDGVFTIFSPGISTPLEVREFEAGHQEYQRAAGVAAFSTAQEVRLLVDSLPPLEV